MCRSVMEYFVSSGFQQLEINGINLKIKFFQQLKHVRVLCHNQAIHTNINHCACRREGRVEYFYSYLKAPDGHKLYMGVSYKS